MSAKLISHTKCVHNDNLDNLADVVAFCARVSNPENQENQKTSGKLIKYLMDHGHWSPFEMVNVCIEITTTRDIARQILRHRSFSFQEFSQRYAKATEFMTREARLQDIKNRQNSISLNEDDQQHAEICKLWEEKQQQVLQLCSDTYAWALDNGIAKEQARSILPEGCTMSKLYMNGTLVHCGLGYII